MTTLRDIADGLRDVLLGVPGLAVFETPPQSASPPMAVVWPPTVDYHETFGSNTQRLIRTTVDVWILTGPAGAFTDTSVRDLWEFADTAGDRSIHAVLSADPTLGGVVETCHVASFRPAGVEEVAGIGFVGGVFSVEVHWRAG